MHRFRQLLGFVTLVSLAGSSAWAADPEIGKTARYCNPLPMVTAPGGNASGDVTVIREQGKYYMYCTGGGAWISDDMLARSFQRIANVPVAPHVVKYNGSFYMCGNSGPLFKADNPLGPFTGIGEWKSPPDAAGGWRGPFDILQAAGNGRLTVRFTAKQWLAGGLYDVRLLKPGTPEPLPFNQE